MQIKIIIISIISLYTISILPCLSLPYGQQSELRTAIQLIQKLSDSSSSEQIEFESAFHETIKAMRLTAGIKVIIVETPQAGPHHESTVFIIDAKPPHLLSAAFSRHIFVQLSENHFNYINEHKSLTITPPTPPPLLS